MDSCQCDNNKLYSYAQNRNLCLIPEPEWDKQPPKPTYIFAGLHKLGQ